MAMDLEQMLLKARAELEHLRGSGKEANEQEILEARAELDQLKIDYETVKLRLVQQSKALVEPHLKGGSISNIVLGRSYREIKRVNPDSDALMTLLSVYSCREAVVVFERTDKKIGVAYLTNPTSRSSQDYCDHVAELKLPLGKFTLFVAPDVLEKYLFTPISSTTRRGSTVYRYGKFIQGKHKAPIREMKLDVHQVKSDSEPIELPQDEVDRLQNEFMESKINYIRNDNLVKSRIKRLERELSDKISEATHRAAEIRETLQAVTTPWEDSLSIHKKRFSDPTELGRTRKIYSLWKGSELVFCRNSGDTTYLATTRLDAPLREETIGLVQALDLSTLLGQYTRELIDESEAPVYFAGNRLLVGDDFARAHEVFEHVRTGIEILPRPEEPSGFRFKVDPNTPRSPGTEPVYRTWGQEYLAAMAPNRTIDGELLGSGGAYIAFIFGDKTFVEFDQEARATYVFETKFFEQLRGWSREDMLNRSPAGYLGRVVHDDEGGWKERIDERLK